MAAEAVLSAAASSSSWAVDIGRSLREGFFMFWATLWPLVLGFAVSGAIQAFVPAEAMQRRLGNHRPAAVARATGYGMVSSSCSYAATAVARSLVLKGSDYLTAMVFMFASTNLVIELGIVLVVLIGWQFAASEFVGGAIMIVLLVLCGGMWFRGRALAEARRHLAAGDSRGAHEHRHGGGERPDEDDGAPLSLRSQLLSRRGWSEAAGYTMADLTMLRRELVIGYVVAGFLAALVPDSFWSTVFVHDHGFWTSLENVVLGPLIAILAFVCSIGNVPLAAALWKGGISFGGVVAFLFADLITLPLLMIYRRFYGWRMMLRMLGVFWFVMSLAGLLTEGLFRAAGLVPTSRPTEVVEVRFEWDYTTWLNFVFLVVFAALYWMSRQTGRRGAEEPGVAAGPR